jgi:hypothetical protein
MKKFSPVTLALCLCLGTAASGIAQTIDGSILYNPNVDLSSGSQNTTVGVVGGIFFTTYSFYPQVNMLGYYDSGGDGLANSHVVTLWDNNTQTIIASATVPAGTSAPLIDGYRWVSLASTVQLNYGSYYVIGAQTDGVDTWGDLISNPSPDDGDSGQINWSSQYVQLGSGWEFTRGGRYDVSGDYPNEPSSQVGNDAIYPVANLGFNLSVPEPTSLGILALGAGLIGFVRKLKR